MKAKQAALKAQWDKASAVVSLDQRNDIHAAIAACAVVRDGLGNIAAGELSGLCMEDYSEMLEAYLALKMAALEKACMGAGIIPADESGYFQEPHRLS